MHIKKRQSTTASSMKAANEVINVPKSPIRTYHINNISNDDEEDTKDPVINSKENMPKCPLKIYNIVTEENTEKEEEKKKNDDVSAADLLTSGIQSLNLSAQSDSQDEKSDDEDVEISPDFVAKCPTRKKDELKEEIRTNAKPYPDRQSSQPYLIHSGGTVFEGSYGHELDNFQNIPESVAEISGEPTISSLDDTDLINILTKEQRNTVFGAIDQIYQPTDDSQIFPSPNYSTSPSDSNTMIMINDSDYYTMSEPSPGSSICSPPPRFGEMSPFACESLRNPPDNSDWRKPQKNPPKYNMPHHDRNIPNVSPFHPVYNIPSPKIEDQLSPNLYSPSPKCNNLDYESVSHDGSSFQLYQENVDNNTSWNSNLLVIHEENVSNIILPSPKHIPESNNDIFSSSSTSPSSAPIQSCRFNIPIQQQQPTIFQIAQPVSTVYLPPPTGRPTKSITIPSLPQQPKNIIPPTGRPTKSIIIPSLPQQPKNTYTQLKPVKIENKKKNIKPDGVSVSEVDLGISGGQRLLKMCNTFEKEVAWAKVVLETEEEINSVNSENQTKLMQILQEEPNKKQFFEAIYTRVRRIQKEKRKELLMKRDINDHSALYMAAIWQKNYPELARFIADTYVELGLNPDEVFGENEDSLLHIIARSGDHYAGTLADLLRVCPPNSLKKAFDVNRKNKNLLTPLHIAATSHNAICGSTLKITKRLINHGANLKIQNSEGKTALHLAVQHHCDPTYIKLLLQSPHVREYINIADNDGNTALHICAANNNISFEKQKDVLNQLKTSGAIHITYNHDGKLPLYYFVGQDKKEEVKNLLTKKH